MSRYQLECDRYQITVGWDNPLRTYFAIIEDPTIEDDEESILLWIGDDYDKIKSLEELKEKIVHYVSVNVSISQKCQEDASLPFKSSQLQQEMEALFAGFKSKGH